MSGVRPLEKYAGRNAAMHHKLTDNIVTIGIINRLVSFNP